MHEQEKQNIALWRLSILGPLISSRLGHGDRLEYFEQAASRVRQQPDGRYVELSARTIERLCILSKYTPKNVADLLIMSTSDLSIAA